MEISVIIPIFNEIANIRPLLKRLQPVMQQLAVEYELIFVNDGSKDGSIELIKEFADRSSEVQFIDFSRNFCH